MRITELATWDGSTALLLDGGSGPRQRPAVHLQAAAGGYLRLVGPDGPLLWGRVDRGYYDVEIVRAKNAALQALPPIRSEDCDAAPGHTGSSEFVSWWTRHHAALLCASSVTPLARGRRYLFGPIGTVDAPGLALRPNSLEKLRAQQDEFVFEWDHSFVGLLLTRPLSDASDGRVKMWRKRARERMLPPIVTWWCRGLFAHILLDGHDRMHAALLEGIVPDVIVLADSSRESDQAVEERRESSLRDVAALERIPSEPARALVMNSYLRQAWDPVAEWKLATPGFPLEGDIERWQAEVAGTSLALERQQ